MDTERVLCPNSMGPTQTSFSILGTPKKKKITSGNLGIFARIPYAIFSPEQRAARVQKLDGNKRENEERKQLDSPAYHGPALFVSRGLRSHTRTFFSQPAMPASEAAVASLNTALERKSKTYR